jgi:hypothetical protein
VRLYSSDFLDGVTPGGYDFYWQLKEAAYRLTVESKSFDDCAKPINGNPRAVEQKHNLDGLKSLHKWMQKNGCDEYFNVAKGSCSSPAGLLTIKLEPEFGYKTLEGKRRIIQLWNTKGAGLSRKVAGVGIYLLQKHLCVADLTDCTAGILDLRKAELYTADALPGNIEAMINAEFAWLDSFLVAQLKAA